MHSREGNLSEASGLQYSGLLSQYPLKGGQFLKARYSPQTSKVNKLWRIQEQKAGSFLSTHTLPGLPKSPPSVGDPEQGHWPLARGVSFLVFQQTLSLLLPSLPPLAEEDLRPLRGSEPARCLWKGTPGSGSQLPVFLEPQAIRV